MKNLKLYEYFIKIEPKRRQKIVDFIKIYCPIMIYRLPFIVNEKIKNQRKLKKSQEKILKDLSLKDLREIHRTLDCKDCDLCDIEIFTKKRDYLKNIKNKLISEDVSGIEKLEILNKLLDECGNLKYKYIKSFNDKFYLQKGENLYQLILSNFIENIADKINSAQHIITDDNIYFLQIARLLLSTDKFLNDVQNIRNDYLKESSIKGIYELKEGPSKNKEKFSQYQKDIDELMKKYRLTPRWRPYIANGVLRYQIQDGELMVPETEQTPTPPDGSPIPICTITEKGSFISGLILAGDEPEKEVNKYKDKYGIKKFPLKKKLRRKPIEKFDTYLRWYKLFQEVEKCNIKDPENRIKNIYQHIFHFDIENKKENDWPGKYHEFFNNYRDSKPSIAPEVISKFERKAELVIGRAVRKLKEIVDNMDK